MFTKFFVAKALILLDCMYDRNKAHELYEAWSMGTLSAYAFANKANKIYKAESGHVYYPSFADTIKAM